LQLILIHHCPLWRAVDVFVDALELRELGFDSVTPAATGRPGYHPSPMLKLYIYGYLNRVPLLNRGLQPHARDEHHRYQTVPRGDPDLRSATWCPR